MTTLEKARQIAALWEAKNSSEGSRSLVAQAILRGEHDKIALVQVAKLAIEEYGQ